MRKYLLIAFLFYIINLNCQHFNGIINYSVTYSNLNISTEITIPEFTIAMGDTEKLYIQSGSYKTEYNGMIMDWVIYKSQGERVFFKMKDEKDIHYKDPENFSKKIHKIEYFFDEFNILDFNCKKLVIHFKDNSKITSYYAPKLYVNSEVFKKHKYDGFYLLISKTNSISLKTIYESKEYTKTITAIDVKKQMIPSNKFDLPNNLKVVKAPW